MAFRLSTLGLFVLAGAVACRRSADPVAAPPPAPAPSAPHHVAILSESAAPLEPKLRELATSSHLDLAVDAPPDATDSLLDAARKRLDERLAALLVAPIAPDPLQRVRQLALEKRVPVVTLMRGDARGGSWVGVKSATLAKECGERAGAWLVQHGCAHPRVVVVEDGLWPETRRRAEATLRGLESACGAVEVPLRFSRGARDDAVASLVTALQRIDRADVLLATDPATTAFACDAASASKVADSIVVLGATDDAARVAAAKASGARRLLVAWRRDDVARLAVEALEEAGRKPDSEVEREVPCELVGLEVTKPK
jgi:ABC-type sugar transport system substrate-binding protein